MSHETYSCPYCSVTITPATEAAWKIRVEEIRAHLLTAHGYYHLPPSRAGESWYRPEDYAEAQPEESP